MFYNVRVCKHAELTGLLLVLHKPTNPSLLETGAWAEALTPITWGVIPRTAPHRVRVSNLPLCSPPGSYLRRGRLPIEGVIPVAGDAVLCINHPCCSPPGELLPSLSIERVIPLTAFHRGVMLLAAPHRDITPSVFPTEGVISLIVAQGRSYSFRGCLSILLADSPYWSCPAHCSRTGVLHPPPLTLLPTSTERC